MGAKMGFTLLELLVVIAIIGLLSSVVLTSMNVARQKSYDARRQADIDQIYKALKVFHTDNGCLPINTGGTSCPGATGYADSDYGTWDSSVAATGGVDPFLSFLVPGYLSSMPIDPESDGLNDAGHSYRYHCYNGPDDFTLVYKDRTGTLQYKAFHEPDVNCR